MPDQTPAPAQIFPSGGSDIRTSLCMLARWSAITERGRLPAMLFMGTISSLSSSQERWSARRNICADVDEVLDALTDPETIARWAPVSFEVDGLAGGRLRPGSREVVSGSIAGIRTTFEVEVHRADTERLELVADGPIVLDVSYRFSAHDHGVLVEAAVELRRQRGMAAQVLRGAVGALLGAGALGSALRRLDEAVAWPVEAELVAA
jgi:uncharacterized protein YndB with AHSA1/START domain